MGRVQWPCMAVLSDMIRKVTNWNALAEVGISRDK